MSLTPSTSPTTGPTTGPTTDPVTLWLIGVIIMVVVMVLLGGVTRLTQSGLSMVDWRPIMGVLPPMSDAAWGEAFNAYKRFPEYQRVNYGMTLTEFKAIFLMEYAHRVWGRLIGLVYALPFAWFVICGRVSGRQILTLTGVLLLGAAQGVMGWIMVKSGLIDTPSVSPYRLAAHLTLAVAIYISLLWIVLTRLHPMPTPGARALAIRARVALACALITLVTGAFVAGLDAGMTYNTFPLMDGRWIPDGLLMLEPVWRNLFENVPLVQFNHRWLAIITVIAVLVLGIKATVTLGLPAHARIAAFSAVAAVLAQAVLGITTLILVVPVALGAAHQAGALLLIGLLTWAVHESRRQRPTL
ncbi:MAG: cytochrome c oxidase assembly protein subunit 15 [Alphaproteobacteria bacterium]|jgi:cytochrome c oxidase assembly protein subunit 15